MNTPNQTFSTTTKSVLHNHPACDRIKSNRKRFLCPACGKHTVLFLLPTTEVADLPVLCKRCNVESIVNISSEPEP